MTERELLERAAKAAGIEVHRGNGAQSHMLFRSVGGDGVVAGVEWNPLTDDGDALRLAATREIDVMFRVVGGVRVEALAPGGPRIVEPYASVEGRGAATRLAIVRAAVSGTSP